jgi:hypothetical protein
MALMSILFKGILLAIVVATVAGCTGDPLRHGAARRRLDTVGVEARRPRYIAGRSTPDAGRQGWNGKRPEPGRVHEPTGDREVA